MFSFPSGLVLSQSALDIGPPQVQGEKEDRLCEDNGLSHTGKDTADPTSPTKARQPLLAFVNQQPGNTQRKTETLSVADCAFE